MKLEMERFIDDYLNWLKSEITYSKVGEYYEINTPFLDNDNDYLQFYVKIDGENLYFTDDGYTVNRLEMSGFQLSKKRKEQLCKIALLYGAEFSDEKELTLIASAKDFPQKKHAFIQCLLHVSDMYMSSHSKSNSYFSDDIQEFFTEKEVSYIENVIFAGKSGFQHNYDFAIPHTRNNPERLCLAINNPNKTAMSSAIFAWSDTKPARQTDSQLIVLLNDSNPIANGVEQAFANYDVNTIRWSERRSSKNTHLLCA